ncbi:hypothetical protein [Methylorubrum zatmanii]|uniref:Uncharacterized protein n=1 Tax=Methylorubrum zatmanii TaxID=29429 RepID=A0ABW1WS31_9HYPH|nr:hypothetical protein [Methylorubrum zatmanii]
MTARNLPSWALLLSLLTTGGAAAQGMAFIEPPKTEPPAVMDQPPAKRPWMLTGHGGMRDAGGRLPNQATGPKRERVVHDICIGCDAR